MRASILVLSHQRAAALELSVGSALAQTVDDLEVIIVGDGVTDDVRTVAQRLVAADSRVVLLDLPKGENHGEIHRDTAIRAARSDAIFYLCDDDLLMPDHVADLLGLLGSGATFVQSLNGHVLPDGSVRRYPGSLSDEFSVTRATAAGSRFNFISVTGTAHSRSFYLQVNRPWSTTPPGEWPDQHQWKKMIGQPGFVGATSVRMTALQFPASAADRAGWTDERSVVELTAWAGRIREPRAQAQLDALVHEATEHQLVRDAVELRDARRKLRNSRRELEAQTRDAAHARSALRQEELRRKAMEHTVSWRVTRPLRAIRRRFRRS